MTTETETPAPPAAPPGVIMVNGKPYLTNHKGTLVPEEAVKIQDRLMDETVRKILGYAKPLAEQIIRFKQHTLDDVEALQELLEQEYKAPRGGQKGNITLTTFDGLQMVKVSVAERIVFGPELQAAKKIIDQCLLEWAADAHPALRAIAQDAFGSQQEGKISPSKLFALLRYDIDDEAWGRAMKAIRDSIRPAGSKEYVNFYRRAKPTDRWEAVSIDVAAA
ncbi:DUF3164 family protein [Phenylobacterium sp.]|jgi:hypothetical protein|uniref:DUF3164 family protein n=1 Tax=Phenylobacterium sp. TaxID=1871053 RepID=UPI002F42421F